MVSQQYIHLTESGKRKTADSMHFLPLIDSGISLYVWESRNFFATVLFTCKAFGEDDAVTYTRHFFNVTEIETKSFQNIEHQPRFQEI